MARMGNGVSTHGPSMRGGGAKSRGAGVSTKAGKTGSVGSGRGAKANSASGSPANSIKKHGKVPGPPPVAGSGNFKPGTVKRNKTR